MKLLVTGGSGFIGTNLLNAVAGEFDEIINLSNEAPMVEAHRRFWREGDILDGEKLRAIFVEARPEIVIHLAARVDCDENTTVEEGYRANVEGTRHLLDAVEACGSVERLVITSSQFVCRAGRMPESETDFDPETVYGESKAVTERVTRERDPDCVWTIVRPTNVWGPYHRRYAQEFWKVLDLGLYVHPGYPTPTRSYAYVGNVVWQLRQILGAPAEVVHRRVFYLGDRPVDIFKWIDGFHREIAGRHRMRIIPFCVVKALARIGDGITALTGRPFYITSSRLRSMTTDYLTPMEPTFAAFGEPPYSLEEGIRETAQWFKTD